MNRALVSKTRYASRSDREREKLQAQISCYALRHNMDRDAEELRKARERIEQPEPREAASGLDSFIERCFEMVDAALA